VSQKQQRRASPIREALSPKWLRHRALILSEAVLAIGFIQTSVGNWILTAPDLHPFVRVLLIMALTVGLFGWLIVFIHRQITRGLLATHKASRKLRLPFPRLLTHILLWVGLFVGYAWLWDHKTGAWTLLLQMLSLRT